MMNQLNNDNTISINRRSLLERFISIRNTSKNLCQNLETEDFVVQPCPEVSPPKWHLAHTTWFFEEMILKPFSHNFKPYHNDFKKLFNSYYKSAGHHWLQGNRGQLSRPTVKEIFEYREFVDKKIVDLLQNSEENQEIDFTLEVGLQHEQQHQELLYMDIKFILATNLSFPKFTSTAIPETQEPSSNWKGFKEGVYEVGHHGQDFSFDNEGPKHKTYIHPFSIRESSISNGEYLKFVEEGAYSQPQLWLSQGWDWVNNNTIDTPLYWRKENDQWFEFTLHGLRPLDFDAPVTHISYFEAHAFANWSGARLPTEFELELFLNEHEPAQKDSDILHPTQTNQLIGQNWYWTRSQYCPYPGYKRFKGKLGEYNGKFMCNQFVLRGGCIVTPKNHYRNTYRNFYEPQQRWMFSGIILAKDL